MPKVIPKLKSDIRMIPLKKIRLDKLQPRQIEDDERAKIDDLAEDVEERGQLYPVMVIAYSAKKKIFGKKAEKEPDCQYWMLDGERRYRAFKKLKQNEIRCQVQETATEIQMYEIQFVANSKRQQISIEEMAKAIERYKRKVRESNDTIPDEEIYKKLAKITGFSVTMMRAADLINYEDDDTQEKIHSGRIGGYFPAELRSAVPHEDDASEAVREGVKAAYKKSKQKRSVLTPRAITFELREVAENPSLSLRKKKEVSQKLTESVWLQNKKQDAAQHTNVDNYLRQVANLKLRIQAWNLTALSDNERNKLATALKSLYTYYSERRRALTGRVGRRGAMGVRAR
jgi:ParB/RepB/Spo0J family partition protein